MSEPNVDQTTHDYTDGGQVTEGDSVLTEPMADDVEPEGDVSTEPAAADQAPFALPEQYASDPRFEGVDSFDKLLEKITQQPQAPDSIDAYQATLAGLNDEAMGGFKKAALDAGLTSSQFDKVVGYYNDQSAQARKMADATLDKYVDTVRDDWGDEFDNNLKTAKTALHQLAPKIDGLKEFMDNPFIGSHPVALRLFHAIGSMISEDVIRTGDAPGSVPKQGGKGYFSTYDKSMEK